MEPYKFFLTVKDGDITILPKRFEKVWYNWLEDCHDWCVSRQLWWGMCTYITSLSLIFYIIRSNFNTNKRSSYSSLLH